MLLSGFTAWPWRSEYHHSGITVSYTHLGGVDDGFPVGAVIDLDTSFNGLLIGLSLIHILSAAGVLGSLTKEYVRPGQVVIDVSINWDPNKVNSKGGKGAIAGDAVFEEVEPIVEAITPVPGGVGSVTTSVLMKHVVEAAERVHS